MGRRNRKGQEASTFIENVVLILREKMLHATPLKPYFGGLMRSLIQVSIISHCVLIPVTGLESFFQGRIFFYTDL